MTDLLVPADWRWLVLLVALLFTIPSLAHEQGTPWAEWFMSLKQPDNHIASCCGPADQFWSDDYEQLADGSFAVSVDGFAEPVLVPPQKVNWQDVNPTGRGVLFMSRYNYEHAGTVYCFVPGNGS